MSDDDSRGMGDGAKATGRLRGTRLDAPPEKIMSGILSSCSTARGEGEDGGCGRGGGGESVIATIFVQVKSFQSGLESGGCTRTSCDD